MRFDEVNLDENVLQGIEAMNFQEMTPVQEQTIPVILEDIVKSEKTRGSIGPVPSSANLSVASSFHSGTKNITPFIPEPSHFFSWSLSFSEVSSALPGCTSSFFMPVSFVSREFHSFSFFTNLQLIMQ